LLDEESARRKLSTYTRQHKEACIVQQVFGEGYGVGRSKSGISIPSGGKTCSSFPKHRDGLCFSSISCSIGTEPFSVRVKLPGGEAYNLSPSGAKVKYS